MLVNRDEFEKYLEREITLISNNTRKKKKLYEEIEEEFGMPVAISSDIFSLRRDLGSYSDFELYIILNAIDGKQIDKYFTSREIKTYSKLKYQVEKIDFPISIKAVQVSEDQWIGSTTFGFLMKLRASQLINYNENTQRTLTRKVNKGVEKFVISLNKTAVKSIKTAMLEERYIADTITLNIQEDDPIADFSYNSATSELIIKSATALDIIDGYHRYIAFAQIYDLNPDFDIPVEIRIVNYPETKANQFIFQADQKTKMKKADSNSFNQFNPGNQVADRLNKDAQFNLCGQIKKNGGYIDYGIFAACINSVCFNNKDVSKKIIIETSKKIKNGINEFTEKYNEYLDKKWNSRETIIIIYGIFNNRPFDNIYNNLNILDDISTITLTKTGKLNNKIIKLLEEV